MQLREMLIGKSQVEAVGTRLRLYLVDRLRQFQVVVELIEVEVEIRAPYLRAPRAVHRRLPDPRHDKGAQQSARLFTQLALGEVDQQNALPVNHFMQVNGRSALTKHVSNSRPKEEGPQLVEDRTDHLQSLAVS